MGLSFFAARRELRSEERQDRAAFHLRSTEVHSSLRAATGRYEEMLLAVGAAMADRPEMSDAEFRTWIENARIFERNPQVAGLAFIVTPDPIERRSRSCFLRVAAIEGTGTGGVPRTVDLCKLEVYKDLWRTRDSGMSSYRPLKLATSENTYFTIQQVVYRGGAVPATVPARRAAFAGWLGIAVAPQVIVDAALGDQQDVAVRLRYGVGDDAMTFTSGDAGADPLATKIDLGDGWSATVLHRRIERSMLGGTTRTVLASGLVLTALLGVIVAILGSQRARAERLVRVRTEELRHQALHDPLTGLANRALLADRLDNLLGRSRRAGTAPAALFLDIDGFKGVNDKLGHDAGDAVLRVVASRLTDTVRDVDTIARLGGDEFVVLVDGGASHEGPELVAERILDALRQPYDLPAAGGSLPLSVSIGVATGDRVRGDDLLRDADLALYEAKRAGRDRVHVHRSPEHTTRASVPVSPLLPRALA